METITNTFTRVIKGYELPDAYNIEDLMAMVPGFVNSLSSVMRIEIVQK